MEGGDSSTLPLAGQGLDLIDPFHSGSVTGSPIHYESMILGPIPDPRLMADGQWRLRCFLELIGPLPDLVVIDDLSLSNYLNGNQVPTPKWGLGPYLCHIGGLK